MTIVFLLAAALLLMAVPAHADPIILPTLISLGVSAVAAPYVSAAITIGISLGLSLVTAALFGPAQPKPSDGQLIIRQSAAPRTRSYGRVKVGGVLMFANTGFGFLHRVIAMGSGEIDAVEEHWIDDNQVFIDGGGNVTSPRYTSHGAPKVLIEYRLGVDAPTAYTDLITACPTFWTTDHLGKGIPSAYIRMQQVKAEEMTDMFPQQAGTTYRQVQRGAKVPNVVGSTITAPDYSDNAARIILDFLTHPDGLRLDQSWIQNAIDTWNDAITVCNELVHDTTGGDNPRYRIWNTYRFDERPADVLTRFMAACDAMIYPTPGQGLAIKVGKWEAPTVTIDDSAIIAFSEVGRGRDILSTTNLIRAQFTDPNNDYQETDAQPWTDDDDIAARGEYPSDLQFFAVPTHPQCRRLMKIAAHRGNPDWVATLICNLRALPVMGERFVTVDCAELGIFDTFEVLNVTPIIDSGSILTGVRVQVASFSSAAYAWDYATEEGSGPGEPPTITADNTLPDPTGFAVSASGEIVTLTWDATGDTFIQTEARYRRTADTAWLSIPVADDATSAMVGPLLDGEEYEFQIRNRSETTGRATDWTASETLTIGTFEELGAGDGDVIGAGGSDTIGTGA